ncbi:hypothetical protein G3N56_00860 [Desulfovibrio sulfodismutans]|uniref:DUF541 domain-containing protein n=1 Tax=Desulfolutivibrio sulfodismutans TaxID=63561 RepID=A0A7K3NGH9_9BACT|nr:hypothetical protein [Desulfolutivibrio sulfodismutans]NDY55296.1 hypothetical protein [Desulfolutivibrio sulfodismutans]QLA12679.1 hypothetical protein GD606_10540 [Desulfolutivibrio sulfodismutans DSM 3696]
MPATVLLTLCLALGGISTLWGATPLAHAQLPDPITEESSAGNDASATLRSAVREDLFATVGLTCVFGPGVAEADARRQCLLKARTRLVAKMSERVAAAAASLGLSLTDEEIAAYTLGVVRMEADREEVEPGPEGLTVRLAGRGVADMANLAQKLPFYVANADVRASAVAQYRAARAEAEAARRSAGDPAQEQAGKIRRQMQDTARFAERQLRLGMSQAEVLGLLGEPSTSLQGAPDENFLCLGYGDVWAVFENGELACLRTRLEYHRRHESQCHCSGRLATILLGVEPR